MRRSLVLLAAVLVALVLVGQAAADSRTARDARGDTKGSHYPGPPYFWSPALGCWITAANPECGEGDYFEDAGPLLDIASVSHGHRGARVVHRVSTVRGWDDSLLGRAGGGQISLYFSIDRDAAFERRLDVYLKRGRAAGVMRAGSRRVGSAAVARPNRKTVEIRFDRRLLARGRVTYRWLAFAGVFCKRQYDRCGDRAPGARLLAHRLR